MFTTACWIDVVKYSSCMLCLTFQEELDEVLRGRDRGARTDQSAEGRRKEHQSELTKKMNQEARVSRGRGVEVYSHFSTGFLKLVCCSSTSSQINQWLQLTPPWLYLLTNLYKP